MISVCSLVYNDIGVSFGSSNLNVFLQVVLTLALFSEVIFLAIILDKKNYWCALLYTNCQFYLYH